MARMKQRRSRPPSGPAGLGVTGTYPANLAIGLPSAAGFHFMEDFVDRGGHHWRSQQHEMNISTASSIDDSFEWSAAISSGDFITFNGTETWTFTEQGRYRVSLYAYGTDVLERLYPVINSTEEEPETVAQMPETVSWTFDYDVEANDTLEIWYEIGGGVEPADRGWISIKRVSDFTWWEEGSITINQRVDPAYSHEFGVREVRAASDVGSIWYPEPISSIPKGFEFACKFAHAGTTSQFDSWVGFASDVTLPTDSGSQRFVGFRRHTNLNSDQFSCMVMNAGVEDRIDTTISASASRDAPHIFGFKRELSGDFTFYRLDLTAPERPGMEILATCDDTNLPTQDLYPVIGFDPNTSNNRGAYVDFFNFGGRIARE